MARERTDRQQADAKAAKRVKESTNQAKKAAPSNSRKRKQGDLIADVLDEEV